MGELLCRQALERFAAASRFQSFYKGLAAGVVIVVVLAGLFMTWAVTQDPDSSEAIVGVFTAVFSAAGLGFVSLQFRNARQDQQRWWEEVEEHCADAEIDALADGSAKLSSEAIEALRPRSMQVDRRGGGPNSARNTEDHSGRGQPNVDLVFEERQNENGDLAGT